MIVRKQSLTPIAFDGLQIFDYTSDADLPSSMAFIEVPAGASHPRAWSRRSGKYYLVADGEVEFAIGDQPTTLTKGDFCYIEQGETFSYENTSGKPAALVLAQTPAFDLSAEVFVAPSR